MRPRPPPFAVPFAVLALTSAAPGAAAQEADPWLRPDPQAYYADGWSQQSRRTDHREEMTRLEIGYRGSFAADAGFDPFSADDYLPEVSLAATRTVIAAGRLSFAAGLAWDHGAAGASARGDATSLVLNRLAVPLEGRVHFGPWGYAFARVAPGATALHAQVVDPSSPAPLSKTAWLFSTDLSAGYAWLIWPRLEPARLTPRLWLQAEGGYGWVARESLGLGPDLASGSSQQVEGVGLGSLSMSGAFFRVAAAASF